MENHRKRVVPLAREALARTRWHLALAIHAALPRPVREEAECPRCGATELVCVGRLEAHGRFTPLAAGARRLRIRTGDPPAAPDTS